jgi:hypothetical protein
LLRVNSFAAITAADFRRPSAIALVVANLVPVLGVLCFGWEIFPLLLLFWAENVVVGVFNVLKMLCATGGGAVGTATKFFIIPFFCVHYGIFTLVHGMFVIGFFGGGFERGGPPSDGFTRAGELIRQEHLIWAVLGLVASHGFSFITNYLGRGEYANASAPGLMTAPYGRIVVLHVTILFGGGLMMALGSPVWGLLLLVALKIALDLRGHLRERAKLAAPEINRSPSSS